MKTSDKPNRLQFRIDIVLTALFLAAIFFMGIMTLATEFNDMRNTAFARKRLKGYLEDPEDYSQWDFLAARIRSLDDYLAQNVYLSTELGQLNSSFQYALGKRMINTGGQQMLTLNSGHLYDLNDSMSMEPARDDILSMRAIVPPETPFLFVYEHPTIYEPSQMPEGYDVLDYSDEIADEIVTLVRDAGVDLLDSRDILPYSGVDLADYLMYTDKHWSTRASLIMAQRIAQELTTLTGTDLHAEKLDIQNFETLTYPQLFLGNYGQRVGVANIAPDDITLYWPKYATNIHRYTYYLGDVTDVEGAFKESVIRWKYLEPDAGKTYNLKAYMDYGLTENYEFLRNDDAADCTILLLKDSYSASIGSFLSLVADNVCAVDLRRSELTLEEWIRKTQPDVVVVAYRLQMLRQDEYEFQ